MAKLGTMLALGQMSTSGQGVLHAAASADRQRNQLWLLHRVSHLNDPVLVVVALALARISQTVQVRSWQGLHPRPMGAGPPASLFVHCAAEADRA